MGLPVSRGRPRFFQTLAVAITPDWGNRAAPSEVAIERSPPVALDLSAERGPSRVQAWSLSLWRPRALDRAKLINCGEGVWCGADSCRRQRPAVSTLEALDGIDRPAISCKDHTSCGGNCDVSSRHQGHRPRMANGLGGATRARSRA